MESNIRNMYKKEDDGKQHTFVYGECFSSNIACKDEFLLTLEIAKQTQPARLTYQTRQK